jgi:hypothetical protein
MGTGTFRAGAEVRRGQRKAEEGGWPHLEGAESQRWQITTESSGTPHRR